MQGTPVWLRLQQDLQQGGLSEVAAPSGGLPRICCDWAHNPEVPLKASANLGTSLEKGLNPPILEGGRGAKAEPFLDRGQDGGTESPAPGRMLQETHRFSLEKEYLSLSYPLKLGKGTEGMEKSTIFILSSFPSLPLSISLLYGSLPVSFSFSLSLPFWDWGRLFLCFPMNPTPPQGT